MENPDPHSGKRQPVTASEQPSKRQRRGAVFTKICGAPDRKLHPEFNKCFIKVVQCIEKSHGTEGHESGFSKYTMQGEQSATTTIRIGGKEKKFKTRSQMHSEMCAADHLIKTNCVSIKLDGDRVSLAKSEKYEPTKQTFETIEPHCGYCTFILSLLGFPLTHPTQGKFNLSSNLEYPLPQSLKSPDIILGLLFCGNIISFTEFIKDEFLEDDVHPEVSVVGNYIEFDEDNKKKLSEFFEEKANRSAFTFTRAEFIWKCFFHYLNTHLKPL